MKCDRVRDQIPEYICQALEGEDLSVFEAHLKKCPECRREIEAFQRLDAQLKQDVPAIWEEIEPSAQFLTQLKKMRYDDPKPGIIEFLSGIWANHRMAMATGLSICFIVVLVVAVGLSSEWGFVDDSDDEEQVALREAILSPAEGAGGENVTITDADEVNEETFFSKGAAGADGADGAQGDPGEVDVSGIGFDTPSATTPPTEDMSAHEPTAEEIPLSEALSIEEITALAKKIALADAEVQQYLAKHEPLSIEVITVPIDIGDFSCNGPLAVIQKAEPLTNEAFILACVNLKTGEVENLKTVLLPPPTQILKPPLNITPEPTPEPEPDPSS